MTSLTRRGAAARTLKNSLLVSIVGACTAVAGCATPATTTPREGVLVGRIASDFSANGPVVVVAIDQASGKVAHRAFLENESYYHLIVPTGKYKVFAFADANRDGVRDAGEVASVLYAVSTRVGPTERIEVPTLNTRAAFDVAAR
jgi:hypothetical protein